MKENDNSVNKENEGLNDAPHIKDPEKDEKNKDEVDEEEWAELDFQFYNY